jgi:hypothetical protein
MLNIPLREHKNGKRLSKYLFIAFILLIFFNCGPKQDTVEKIMEDGVEVIINHLEPYKIGEMPQIVKTEQRVLIDFESQEITKLGIADIRGFDIDSEDNIYISVYTGEYCIYKFNSKGVFITSFARKGQGPREMQIAKSLCINNNDKISAFDTSKQNFLIFDSNGNFLEEIHLPHRITRMFPLANGNFLVSKIISRRRSPFYYFVVLALYDSEMNEIKQIEELKIPNGPGASYWMAFRDNIYVGSEERGYEIWIYDLEGKLIRKIKKEYNPVEIPEEIRELWKKAFDKLRQQTQFQEDFKVPLHWPPFFAFFIDDEERLFVRTFEEGRMKGEYLHDIFNPDGIFIGRTSLNLSINREYKYAKSQNNRIFGLTEKENGYEQLVYYKMNWE